MDSRTAVKGNKVKPYLSATDGIVHWLKTVAGVPKEDIRSSANTIFSLFMKNRTITLRKMSKYLTKPQSLKMDNVPEYTALHQLVGHLTTIYPQNSDKPWASQRQITNHVLDAVEDLVGKKNPKLNMEDQQPKPHLAQILERYSVNWTQDMGTNTTNLVTRVATTIINTMHMIETYLHPVIKTIPEAQALHTAMEKAIHQLETYQATILDIMEEEEDNEQADGWCFKFWDRFQPGEVAPEQVLDDGQYHKATEQDLALDITQMAQRSLKEIINLACLPCFGAISILGN